MFYILKLMLIILLNNTYAHITQDIQMILLPAWNPSNAKKIQLTLNVFGKQIQLNLRRNDRIVSPAFEAWKHNANGAAEKFSLLKASDHCFYHHEDRISSAAINFCNGHGLEGLVFLKNDILEIRPLRNDFAPLNLMEDICVRGQINFSFGKPHLIKRSLEYFANSNFYYLDNFKPKQRYIRNTEQKLTIELAVFFDEAAYRSIMPFLDNDYEKLNSIILAYVNRIHAAYHYPSLGIPIDISLVRLEIMKTQPLNLPVYDGDDIKLLKLFCKYAKTHNSPDDKDPHHWDIGLYLTGVDLYKKAEQKNYGVMGISNYNGACDPLDSCAIVEFGTTSTKTSAGFASSLFAIHEIGHLLGMEHYCYSPKYKHIMTSHAFYRSQVKWSKCSREIAEGLWETKQCLRDHTRPENIDNAYDHSRYHDVPGREWTAKAQCELFMRDKNANVVTLLDICETLQCETPHKNESFFAGPALDGTDCAHGKECRGGKCVPVLEPPYIFKYCEMDNWSEWKEDSCNSSCLSKSKGMLVKRRSCKHGTNRTAKCGGPYYDVVLCNDSKLCTENRKTIDEFTAMRCTEFSTFMSTLDKKPGCQVFHDVEKPWVACTIYCRRNNSSSCYAPRLEMLDFGIDPYFPDGTWCHNKNGQDYYCRKHYCLPEYHSFEE